MKKFLCFIGLHNWRNRIYRSQTMDIYAKRCKRCGEETYTNAFDVIEN